VFYFLKDPTNNVEIATASFLSRGAEAETDDLAYTNSITTPTLTQFDPIVPDTALAQFIGLGTLALTADLSLPGPKDFVTIGGFCPFGCDNSTPQLLITYDYTPAATPLPAALPLFAGGLGVISLFGWRRKWKGRAVG
jgi:hypothetical protein